MGRRTVKPQTEVSIAAVLIAMSIVVTAPADAAPLGAHRPSLVQVIRHKIMGMVAAAEGGMKMKAAQAAMAAKAAKAKQASIGQAPAGGTTLSVAR
jgi:hypothetical protein